MDKFFVFFHDDYADNGGIGLEEFSYKSDALNFITNRLNRKETELSAYTLIRGKKLNLKVIEKITEITAE